MDLDEIAEAKRILGNKASVLQRFPSKKNSVYLVQLGSRMAVLKMFPEDGQRAMDAEKQSLTKSLERGIFVPKILEEGERHLLLERIEGQRAFDIIYGQGGMGCKMDVCKQTAHWLAGFHHAFREDGLIRGDANLKNFISTGEEGQRALAGLDFEEAREGDWREDMARFCVSLLASSPPINQEKIVLAEHFTDYYSKRKGEKLELEDLTHHIVYAMQSLAKWRKDGPWLTGLAEKIRNEGIRVQAERQQP
ncbi:MAG: hypothetical protein QCI38_02135 [Candidatus Thermoplasmatota archaeon]|nr:hypothetical protein [Candidatus Thermoplasmatota archaeon]